MITFIPRAFGITVPFGVLPPRCTGSQGHVSSLSEESAQNCPSRHSRLPQTSEGPMVSQVHCARSILSLEGFISPILTPNSKRQQGGVPRWGWGRDRTQRSPVYCFGLRRKGPELPPPVQHQHSLAQGLFQEQKNQSPHPVSCRAQVWTWRALWVTPWAQVSKLQLN